MMMRERESISSVSLSPFFFSRNLQNHRSRENQFERERNGEREREREREREK